MTIVFDKVTMIPFVSDAGPDTNKKFEVKLDPSMNVDVTLPTLFQQMTIILVPSFQAFSGHLLLRV
ncbi:hypothetical protein GGS21DRAFT_348407 [Xylaria nigripes]|nr:hypothetical protein GGS21DRAFT_348407 [Xylaria nigripes]